MRLLLLLSSIFHLSHGGRVITCSFRSNKSLLICGDERALDYHEVSPSNVIQHLELRGLAESAPRLAKWRLPRQLRSLTLPADAFVNKTFGPSPKSFFRGMEDRRLPTLRLAKGQRPVSLRWQLLERSGGGWAAEWRGVVLWLAKDSVACDCASRWLHGLPFATGSRLLRELSMGRGDRAIGTAELAREEEVDVFGHSEHVASSVEHFNLPKLHPQSSLPCTPDELKKLQLSCIRPDIRLTGQVPGSDERPKSNKIGEDRSLTCSLNADKDLEPQASLSFRTLDTAATEQRSTIHGDVGLARRYTETRIITSLEASDSGWAVCESWSSDWPSVALSPLAVEALPSLESPSPQQDTTGDLALLVLDFPLGGFPLPRPDQLSFTLNGSAVIHPMKMRPVRPGLTVHHFYKASVRLRLPKIKIWEELSGEHTLTACNALGCANGSHWVDGRELEAVERVAVAPLRTTKAPWFLPLVVALVLLSALSLLCLATILLQRRRSAKSLSALSKTREETVPLQDNDTYVGMVNSTLPVVPYASLEVVRELGEGAFGTVFLANVKDLAGAKRWRGSEEEASGGSDYEVPAPAKLIALPAKVALKTLKHPSQEQMGQLHKEAELLVGLDHPHVVSFFGVAQSAGDLLLVFEFMDLGDLKSYLRQHGPQSHALCGRAHPRRTDKRGVLSYPEQLNLCIQIARGLGYLERKAVVHRDLAARNCLLSSAQTPPLLKLSDFGMSRAIASSDYYRMDHTRTALPVRWLPPESLSFGTFSRESDIWSLGVTMWEVMSYGMLPYGHLSNAEVVEEATGRRIGLPQPPNSQPALYQLVRKACTFEPSERPSVGEMEKALQALLGTAIPERMSFSPPSDDYVVGVVVEPNPSSFSLDIPLRHPSITTSQSFV